MNGARTKVPAPEPQTAIPVATALFFFKRNKELDECCYCEYTNTCLLSKTEPEWNDPRKKQLYLKIVSHCNNSAIKAKA